jgi:hypothetical protein
MKDNQINWQKWVMKFKEGDVYFVAPNWSQDNWRTKIFRLARKGYFKVVTKRERKKRYSAYGDYFERTNKPFIEGDSPKKPITFSCTKTLNLNQNEKIL